MHPALVGFLAGLALAAFFIISEYMIINAAAAERGKKLKKKPVVDDEQRKRLKAIWGFAFFIPPAFTIAGWVLLPLFGYPWK
jgi:hypothetical protein